MPKGQINKKFNSKGEEVTSPISVFDAKKFYEGTVYTSSDGQKYVIEEYNGENSVKIRFLDNNYTYDVYRSAAIAGTVKNIYKPMKYGGYIGEGPYGRKNDTKAYMTWIHMHERVYKAQNQFSDYIDYENVTIAPEWENFQVFAPWFYQEISNLNPNYQYTIDKDIFQWNQKDKVYGPNTSAIIPLELNSALSTYQNILSKYGLPVGVIKVGTKYKAQVRSRNKEINYKSPISYDDPMEAFQDYRRVKLEYLHKIADRYYNDNAISKRVYDQLYAIDIEAFSTKQLTISNLAEKGKIKDQQLVEKDQLIDQKDQQLMEKNQEIERLKALLNQKQNN